jgi:hypothetical protein
MEGWQINDHQEWVSLFLTEDKVLFVVQCNLNGSLKQYQHTLETECTLISGMIEWPVPVRVCFSIHHDVPISRHLDLQFKLCLLPHVIRELSDSGAQFSFSDLHSVSLQALAVYASPTAIPRLQRGAAHCLHVVHSQWQLLLVRQSLPSRLSQCIMRRVHNQRLAESLPRNSQSSFWVPQEARTALLTSRQAMDTQSQHGNQSITASNQ